MTQMRMRNRFDDFVNAIRANMTDSFRILDLGN